MDLLLLNDADKSHHVYIEDFKRFVFHQTKNKNNGFLEVVYIVLVVQDVLTKHKEDYLSINGKQSVKLEEGTIEFKNYFKQIPVLFKIYAVI